MGLDSELPEGALSKSTGAWGRGVQARPWLPSSPAECVPKQVVSLLSLSFLTCEMGTVMLRFPAITDVSNQYMLLYHLTESHALNT